MKLQKASRFALYAVLELAATPREYLTAAEIAERYGVSMNHLGKIMRNLVRAGLVESVRGAKGGFRFCGNAKRTTLMDVIQLFETIGDSPGRAREPGETTNVGRAIDRVLGEIDEIAQATLRSITIDTMFKIIRRQRAGETPEEPAGRALVS
jgi:Rrf2 family transcriptional regulator, nitric oxide-sensitive transcriptional repressor